MDNSTVNSSHCSMSPIDARLALPLILDSKVVVLLTHFVPL